MEFANPWGLLALLSIPSILVLHYFHSQQRVQVIGGLHLWEFARIQMPVGRKFDRLLRNVSLLMQLLAALLFSLLIAGMDFPRESTQRHFTVILDDSVSMQAGEHKTSAQRAQEALVDWARDGNRYTLIAAGSRPRVIAGPFATRVDFIKAITEWQPEDINCDIEAAINLASKFSTDSGKALLYTDDESLGKAFPEAVEVGSVGDNFDNAAIDYAERIRADKDKDNVIVTVKAYSRGKMKVGVRAFANKEQILDTSITLEALESNSVTFETDRLGDSIEIQLSGDGFGRDNTSILSPVTIKTVRVARMGLDPIETPLKKAIESLPYASFTDFPARADLVFATRGAYTPTQDNLRIVYIPNPERADVAGAEGRDLVVSRRDMVTRNLSLEGIVWGYDAKGFPAPEDPDTVVSDLVTIRGTSVLTRVPGENQSVYELNLLTDRTNIFRNVAWPILVSGLVEETRGAIPGLTRTNYRLGEAVALKLSRGAEESGEFELLRDGKPVADYEEIPELLPELSAGVYTIKLGEKQVGQFSVNLFAPEESDLRALSAKKPDYNQLIPDEVARREKSAPLFFLLLLLALTFTAGSWISQDLSR